MVDHNGQGSSLDNDDAVNPSFEGTAARTRPCSFEDIMLKRYSKRLVKDVKEGSGSTKLKSELVKPGIENSAQASKHSVKESQRKDSVEAPFHPLKKNSLDEVPMSRVSSSRKQEKHHVKDSGSLKRIEKDDRRMSPRTKLHKEDNSKAFGDSVKHGIKEEKNEKRSHHKSKGSSEQKQGDHRTEDAKEQMKDKKDRIKERIMDKPKKEEKEGQRKHEDERGGRWKTENDRASREDNKRKHGNELDEKRKTENDRTGKRKHDAKAHPSDKVDRRQDDDYSERKERWKDSSWQKETKSKRRKRSLSPDPKKVKERGRSSSPSPRSHKRHSSYHGKDHDMDSSSHHQSAERLERDRMDSERNVKDSDAYGSHFRRYGAGSSGLGGYSPRRRRSEAAVKTPSPPVHLPDRKPAWDLTPGGMDSNMVAAMLAAYQASTQQITASTNTPTLSTVSLSTTTVSASQVVPSDIQQVNSSVDAVELTQSTRPARRVVVNNLPSSVSDGELMEFLNSAMLSASANNLLRTKPCISCVVNGDKNHAYAEFLKPEDATAALLLDGITLNGNTLKIKRPKDYIEPSNGGLEKTLPVVDSMSSLVIDSPHKIFVGGISRFLSSDKVKEIVTAFGQLKAFHFELNTSKRHDESYAFLEYVDQSVTLKACAGLNGMELGGRIITVVQATPDASGEVDSIPFYGIPEHAKALMQQPTRILKLSNVLTKEELLQLSEAEIEEILGDVRLECTRFGSVKSINIVRCNNEANNITSVQAGENGKLEKCLQDTDINENHSKPLTDQERKATECNKENERDSKDASVGVGDIQMHLKEEAFEGDQMENGMVETGDSNNNALDNSNQSAGSKKEDNTGEAHEADSADKVTDNMVMLQSIDICVSQKTPVLEILQDGGDSTHKNLTAEKDESLKDCEMLEVGSVLVEFSREEATCMAAHSLHRRLYGSRNVITSYIPNTIYQKRFPRGSLR